MTSRRVTILADRRGTLTAIPTGNQTRAADAQQRGFRFEVVRVNLPRRGNRATIGGAYSALLRIYAL